MKMLNRAIYVTKRTKKGDVPVRDHCHVTGKYRGSAHTNCNLSYRLTNKIYVIFHNLRGYDSKDGFYHTENEFGPNNLELITKKGVYPYVYMDGFDKFDEKGLPSIENFYSKLTCEDISNSDYNHAKNVWEEFKCKTMGEYHDLYLKSDVLILADVFENFRKTSKEY